MWRVLTAVLAKLFDFEPFFQGLFIFTRKIIDALANSTLKLDHVILRHLF